MIEFIDYEKRLTCEEHIVLLYYSLMYKKKHANYSEFQITELLIDEYNLDNNQEKRSEVEKMVERKKEDLDKFGIMKSLLFGVIERRRIIILSN